MWCNIHKLEYDYGVFNLSCPRCKQEEERRDEAREAHEESLAEQRRHGELLARQNEILERARAENAEREWERQATLERMARAEEERLEEERAHRKAEETKAALRAGLPEFPEEFQTRWRHINEQITLVDQQEEAFRQEFQKRRSAVDRKKSTLAQIIAACQEKITKRFEAARLTAEGQHLLAALPHGRSDGLPGFSTASQTYKDVMRMSTTLSGRSLPGELPDHVAPVLLTLESIEAAIADAKPLKKLGWGVYVAAWFVMYFVFGTVLGALISAGGGGDGAAGATLGFVLAFAGVLALRLFWSQKGSETDEELRRLWSGAIRLSTALAGDVPTTGSAVSLSQSEATQALRRARSSLAQPLLTDYFNAQVSSEPESPEIKRLQAELTAEEAALQSLEERFEQSKEVRDLVKYRYLVTYQEILRVGREVSDGIRVPGRQVAMLVCGACSELVDKTLTACPYCDSNYEAKAG